MRAVQNRGHEEQSMGVAGPGWKVQDLARMTSTSSGLEDFVQTEM